MTIGTVIAEAAHQMGLIPLGWLAGLALRGKRMDAGWWWLGAAFAVSWVADWTGHLDPWSWSWMITLVYPVAQAALVAAVLLPQKEAMEVSTVLALVAVLAIVWRGPREPDVIVASVAAITVVWVTVNRWELGRLRVALLVYFGLGWLFWLWHARVLTVGTWTPYQVSRLAGLVLFCWATLRPTTLRLVKS